ncbi:MAG TPA: response regulator transcription factor [Tichowtungia sp.]|nr:response regulator transcription factor [Tichowtungia sp.]
MNTIRLMLIEDSEDYRNSIVRVLGRKPGMEVISQYGTAEIALQNLEEWTEDDLPDIILLDLNLPGMSGLDAIPLIRQQAADVKIIILTQSDKEADVLRAIRLGASGYLLKSASIHSLTDEIELVHSGKATLDSNLAKFILNTASHGPPELNPEAKLSKRELDVLTLIAEGEAQKQIASRLNISIYTVKEHIHHIFSKLEAQNAPAAVSKAYRFGILPTEK